MSAWDVAGAVIWTPISAFLWLWIVLAIRQIKAGGASMEANEMGGAFAVAIVAILTGLPGVFCIARLAGAHI